MQGNRNSSEEQMNNSVQKNNCSPNGGEKEEAGRRLKSWKRVGDHDEPPRQLLTYPCPALNPGSFTRGSTCPQRFLDFPYRWLAPHFAVL